MTLKTSLTIGLAVAALVVGVQAASASPQDASDRANPSVAVSPDAFERAVLARELSNRLSAQVPRDAFERAVVTNQGQLGGVGSYPDAHGRSSEIGTVGTPMPDAFERALNTSRTTGAFVAGDSHGRVDILNPPVSVPTATSGREIEWPQVGIGFGVGILLALGLWLAVRLTHVRPLAH
jgi:hypothetical protein